MSNKLYVGNLAYTVTDDDLRSLFAQAGTVTSATVIMDRETRRSKGFGFVEMASPADAQKAISMFNNQRQWERPLTVNIARPREERPPRSGDYGGGGYGGGGKGGRNDRGGKGGRGDRRDRY